MDSILQAATRVLIADGYDGLRTNRLVEVAGVGIGSLYEYFPNKDAIVVALTNRFAETLYQELQRTHSSLAGMALEEALGRLVRAAFSIYEREPRLAAELLQRVPYLKDENPLNQIEGPIRMQLAELLSKHVGTINVSNLQVASMMIVRSARRLIDDAFSGMLPQEAFDGDVFEEVEREMLIMLRRYLIKG